MFERTWVGSGCTTKLRYQIDMFDSFQTLSAHRRTTVSSMRLVPWIYSKAAILVPLLYPLMSSQRALGIGE
jgi:hypothetical protein